MIYILIGFTGALVAFIVILVVVEIVSIIAEEIKKRGNKDEN